jgi:hypothetical protein
VIGEQHGQAEDNARHRVGYYDDGVETTPKAIRARLDINDAVPLRRTRPLGRTRQGCKTDGEHLDAAGAHVGGGRSVLT